jgi:hypothetical protein
MPQRDYLLRLIEQAGLMLRRAIEQRERRSPQEALQSVMAGCERLFGLEAVELFRLTPDQHYAMLTAEGAPDAREKVLIYAALNAEAARAFLQLNQPAHARQSFVNALRLVLQARLAFPADGWPDYAPREADLLAALAGEPLDADTAALLASVRGGT